MSRFANGKHSFGFCDLTGFLVGKDVVDKDQPQLQLGKVKVDDPKAIRNPRPDRGLEQSRALFAFDPVGGGVTAFGSRTVGLDIEAQSGKVTVVIS